MFTYVFPENRRDLHTLKENEYKRYYLKFLKYVSKQGKIQETFILLDREPKWKKEILNSVLIVERHKKDTTLFSFYQIWVFSN